MNNLVYLYELDSVCNSSKEMEFAMKALYKTIAVDGDIVVLTFNQFTDSMLMLSIMNDKGMYDAFFELFKEKRIIVSEYKKGSSIINDPLKYVYTNLDNYQNNIDNGSSEKNKYFIFSAVDCLNISDEKQRQEIYQIVSNCLKVNKPNYVANELSERNISISSKYVELLECYVKFLIQISFLNNKTNEAKDKDAQKSLVEVFDIAINCLKHIPDRIKGNLKGIRKILAEDKKKNVNSRSEWFDLIGKRFSDCDRAEAEKIMNVCYNIAVESSISGVNSILDVAKEEEYIIQKYEIISKQYENNEHTYGYIPSKSNLYSFSKAESDEWKYVAKLIEIIEVREYENKLAKKLYNIIDSKVSWKNKIRFCFRFITLCNIFKFFALGILLLVQCFTKQNIVDAIMPKMILPSTLYTIFCLLFEELFSHIIKLPNLFDVIKLKKWYSVRKTCKKITKYNVHL